MNTTPITTKHNRSHLGDMIFKMLLAFCGVFLCAVIALVLYFYNQIPNYPTIPVASGDFPSKPIWIFQAEDQVIATPVVRGSQIFLRTSNWIYSIDRLTGKVLWRSGSPGVQYLSLSPKIYDKFLIVPEKGSRIAAFSTDLGQLIWRTSAINTSLYYSTIASIQAIALENDSVYVARFDWGLTAYDIHDGRVIWDQKIPGRTSPYIVSDKTAVYLGAGRQLYAYDANTGVLLWQKYLTGDIGPIILDDNILYITQYQDMTSLTALDLNSLNVIWAKEYIALDKYDVRCLSVLGDILYAGAIRLMAITKNSGTIIWTSTEMGRLECPLVLDERLYVRNTDTTLYSLNRLTGQEMGRLLVQTNTPMKHEPDRSPAVSEDLLIVPFGDNRVFAYRP